MTDLRTAAQQALEALEALEIHSAIKHPQQRHYRDAAIEALRAALAQKEQEPFGYFQYAPHFDAWVQNRDDTKGVAFYTHPPRREWQGLTEPELHEINPTWPAPGEHWGYENVLAFARAIEAALKEKNA